MHTNLSNKMLLVPIQLDALLTKTPTSIVDAMADFSKLPYCDGTRDYNSERAYISEDIVSKPFHNQNTVLATGIHLHWSLPDSLTHVFHGEQFPCVPDRWLITRQVGTTMEKQWIVESNFIHPPNPNTDTTGYTSLPWQDSNNPLPFRLLGRSLEYNSWLQESVTNSYWEDLSVIGYGEPTFAALYSNCASVFGFFDIDYNTNNVPSNLSYEIVGWYSNINNDELAKFTDDWQRITDGQGTVADFKQQLQSVFEWTYEGDDIPEQMACYAKLFVSPESAGTPGNSNLDLVVANTVSEALSTLLANKLSPGQAGIIEEQLEAVQLATKIEQQLLDLGAKFQESRHEKSFTSIKAGTIWLVKYQDATETSDDDETEVTLPIEMASLLNELNRLQGYYDKLSEEIDDLSLRLFSDWYKYMICAHPPEFQRDYPRSDEVRFFLETVDFTLFDDTQNERGVLSLTSSNSGVIQFDADRENTVASQLAQQGNALIAAIADYNAGQQDQLILKVSQAPRYWQANEPVILLSGDNIAQTSRYGLDGLLTCHLQILANDLSLSQQLLEINNAVDSFLLDDQGISVYTQQPWNPFLLEWKVEFFPAQTGRDLQLGYYQPEYITTNYELPEDQPDFISIENIAYQRESNVYTGTSILTGNAGQSLNTSLQNYLTKNVLQDYYEVEQIPEDEQTDDYLITNIDAIITWYIDPTQNNDCSYNNPVYTSLYAYQLLNTLDYLAQSLGGFNQALLMFKQTLQLRIDDPLAFADTQPFITDVALRVGDLLTKAPETLVDFNPVRAGALQIQELNLIDSFGQVQKLSWNNILSSATLPKDGQGNLTLLPRFAQPARLNLRWLSAADDEEEMNDHPATTPICGWLLPNYLDNNLMVYDAAGTSIGAITMNATHMWQPNPGDANPKSVEQIANAHLQNLVGYIIQQGIDYLEVLLDNLENALENIDPEIYAQHFGLSILVGRPIAVTRVKVELQLKGLPAHHQGWNAFRQDLHRNTRESYEFASVQIPVRIGEHQQLNDGVVGYWMEDDNFCVGDTLYLPQSEVAGNDNIVSYTDRPLDLMVAIAQDPIYLTVLFDPRGQMHATSGILPTKVINIPPDQFADAFENIDLSFLTTPVIVGQAMALPLPPEPNFRWSWAEIQANGYWREVSTEGTVHKEQVIAVFEDGQQLWDTLLAQGWLQMTAEDYANEAVIVPVDQRPTDDLGQFNDQKQTIEAFLQQSYLQTDALQTLISQQQMIKEGWLKLRKSPTE